MTEPDCLNLFERLVKLETEVRVKFEEREKAVELARVLINEERVETKTVLDKHLEALNSLIMQVRKWVLVGAGIILVIEVFLKYFVKG